MDYARQKDATEEWIDIVNEKTTTLDDLMALVAAAEWENGRE